MGYIIEFFKANWVILIQVCIAIATIIVMYHIHHKGKSEENKKEEKKFREDIEKRLTKIETKIDMLTQLYPQLKSLEKLENFDKLNLSEKDIKETVSEVLKTTNITPEALEARIEEKIEKRFSDFDKGIATIVAQKLNEIDKRFKKPIGDAFVYLILGNSEYYKGNYLKSIEYFNKVIELKPDFAEAWNNKGVTLGNLGLYEEALKAFNKTIELKSDYAYAWSNKGVTLDNIGRYEEALKAFEKAIELKLDYAEALYNKGVTLSNLGRYEEALKVYNNAIEIKPDFAHACYGKGFALGKLGRYEEALKNLSNAIELDPKYKEQAKKDEDFKNFWDDDDFKKIVS